jgi:hypothetical protein
MLRGLTAKQFIEWGIYSSVEPFSERWADYRAASIVWEIRNALRGKDQKAPLLDECLIKPKEESDKPLAPQTVEEQIAIAKTMARMAAKIHQERKGGRE